MIDESMLMEIEVSFNDDTMEKYRDVESYQVSTTTLTINTLKGGVLKGENSYPLEKIRNVECLHGLDDET